MPEVLDRIRYFSIGWESTNFVKAMHCYLLMGKNGRGWEGRDHFLFQTERKQNISRGQFWVIRTLYDVGNLQEGECPNEKVSTVTTIRVFISKLIQN